MKAVTLFTFGFPSTQRVYSMEWHPISINTPPPERFTSQNHGIWGPGCSSDCFARKGSPIAPSSMSVLARTYFGANNSSSAYMSSTPCFWHASII